MESRTIASLILLRKQAIITTANSWRRGRQADVAEQTQSSRTMAEATREPSRGAGSQVSGRWGTEQHPRAREYRQDLPAGSWRQRPGSKGVSVACRIEHPPQVPTPQGTRGPSYSKWAPERREGGPQALKQRREGGPQYSEAETHGMALTSSVSATLGTKPPARACGGRLSAQRRGAGEYPRVSPIRTELQIREGPARAWGAQARLRQSLAFQNSFQMPGGVGAGQHTGSSRLLVEAEGSHEATGARD